MAAQTLKTLHPFLAQNDTKTSSGCTVRSYSHDNGNETVLVMVHGYPQSSYEWRHVVSPLSKKSSLFIPELPGYGVSSPPPTPDKKAIASILLEACTSLFGPQRPLIWCSHDRGARIGHRVLANPDPQRWNLKAGVFMDIVPTLEQWRSFASPAASTAYFHWPFLATDLAPKAIERMGGGEFCRMLLERGKGGSNTAGLSKLQSDDAYDHYCAQFSKPECIKGSCDDYAEGSVPECEAQERDQREGRKVKVPLLVLYSAVNLGRMHDVPARWRDWVEGELECVAVGEGHGHYFPESWPEFVVEQVSRWVRKVEV